MLDHQQEVSGWVRASGSKLINGDGREILLRGVGFGSWTLPEGYMWRFPAQGDRPRRIERMIEQLIGKEKAAQFWAQYYDRHTSEADIRQIAAEGFNSVRVPINARFLLDDDGSTVTYREEHFRLLDRLIGWCREHRLYVILDLHGAPGGQTGTNIDDSEFDRPELFTDERNKRVTAALWRTLAERYKDEWIVAGYDLLNEPLPDWFSAYNDQVMPLYREIIAAIREVDDRHMIILEGAHWATDWSIFDEKPDGNLMLQFHKYWNNPDTESIQPYLDKRDEWNVPLYMGEGGENNTDWYAGAFRLFEDHDISWNFWTWKKMDTGNSPCSIRKPAGWQRLVDYLEGGEKPDPAEAERILWEYLELMAFDKCDYRPEVVRSLFRRAPVRVPAIFYGFQGEGRSFGGVSRSESPLEFRLMDGMDIRFVDSSRRQPNFQHGGGEAWQPDDWLYVQLAPGGWVAYEFTVGAAGAGGAAEAAIAADAMMAADAAQESTAAEATEAAQGSTAATAMESTEATKGAEAAKVAKVAEATDATDAVEAAQGSTAAAAASADVRPGGVSVRLRMTGQVGWLAVEVDDRSTEVYPAPSSEWKSVDIPFAEPLQPGVHRLVLRAENQPFGIQWVELKETAE